MAAGAGGVRTSNRGRMLRWRSLNGEEKHCGCAEGPEVIHGYKVRMPYRIAAIAEAGLRCRGEVTNCRFEVFDFGHPGLVAVRRGRSFEY
jgi:hypothetical protein